MQVLRSVETTAYATILAQEALLRVELDAFRADVPDWVAVYPMRDETRQSVRFNRMERSTKVSCEVFVTMIRLAFGWRDRHTLPKFIDCVTPPIPVVSTQSANVRDALRNHFFTRRGM